jgi:hypothetical protein
MHIPSEPKWDRAIDGLDMKDFTRQAQEFERSLFPRDMVFPREGEVWRAWRDCEVIYMAWFARAALGPRQSSFPHFLPSGTAQLTEGEEARILPLDDPRPMVVHFLPIRYAELEEKILPANLWLWPGYSNYQLSAPTARALMEKGRDYFTDSFLRVASAPGGP